jgi:phosphoribosylformylglycinamidine cyclo-ligase
VFGWLQKNGGIEEREMLRTFNCGIGMVLVTPPGAIGDLQARVRDLSLECFEIGEVTSGGADRVRYSR